MQQQTSYLSQIFGNGRQVPLSYVQRYSVDNIFLRHLSDDKLIVVHGASGLGKSMLIKQYLQPDQYCTIQCATYHKRFDIYRTLLGEANASVKIEKKKSKGKRLSATISFFSGEGNEGSESTEKVVDIDLGNINDIIRVLRDNAFTKYIIIEDFHYLEKNIQKEILNDLKTVVDKSNLQFIFIGIWTETEKFLHLNGNLSGKINSLSIERWSQDELAEVIKAGLEKLNVSFSDAINQDVLSHSFGSISVLQELCYLICYSQQIHETQARKTIVADNNNFSKVLNTLLEGHSIRIGKFLIKYSKRGVKNWLPDDVDYYKKQKDHYPTRPKDNINKWIALSLLNFDTTQLLQGITLDDMKEKIDHLRKGKNLPAADRTLLYKRLKNISRRQRDMNIHPVLFSFNNESETLHVADTIFINFIHSSALAKVKAIIEAITDNQTEYEKLVANINAARKKYLLDQESKVNEEDDDDDDDDLDDDLDNS